ncbi:MAG: hypothetical protein K2K46_04640, partial [Lachnospiraceae bacterium]|nr:hypothetical protein [Lachnospiraceae bacterium]
MDEQRAWIKSRRKRWLRITAVILSVCLLVTTYPDILEAISVFAAGARGEDAIMSVTGFAGLSEEVSEQTVPVGTDISELELPDTLEAYVSVESEDEKKPDDGGQKKDDDEDPEDSDQNKDDKENPDETGGEEKPDDGNDNNVAADDSNSSDNAGSETDGSENSGTDTSEPQGGGNSTDTAAPAAVETPDNTKSADVSVQTGEFVMPEYQSENVINVETLENIPADEAKSATDTDAEGAAYHTEKNAKTETIAETEAITIENITWDSSPAYDGEEEGLYIFTPTLPDGYVLSNGVSLPEITVTVVADYAQAEKLHALLELLRALPDPEDYLTYDEAEDLITEHEDIINKAQLEEVREAADEYLDKYPDADMGSGAGTGDANADPDSGDGTESADTQPASLTALLTRLEGLEHIRDTVADCMDFDCPYHYPKFVQSRMAQDEVPEFLTLEDLIEDYGVEEPAVPAAQTYGSRAYAANAYTANAYAAAYAVPMLHPQTLMLTDDNEDNAHTGNADGDIDEYLSHNAGKTPIEISFTIDELPIQSAYLAVKVYDVDEEYGEHDYVYLNDDIYKPMALEDKNGKPYNDDTIGYLAGTNNTWNTSVLEIPLEKLVKGKNVISITIASGWLVEVDWMQLILDGGAADPNIEEFSLKIKEAVTEGGNVTVHSDVTIRQKGNTQYATEYTLTQESTGEALDACFGSALATETAVLTMPLTSPTGVYKITGILKNPDTEEIKAVDNITFNFTQDVGVGPKASHTLTPDTLTNQDVTIRVSVEEMEGVTNATVTPTSRTVTANGTYDFTVNYQMGAESLSNIYHVKVTNIDNEAPVIAYSAITVTESLTQAQMEALFAEALTVTDNVTKDCTVTYTLPKVADVLGNGGGQVTVTAQD